MPPAICRMMAVITTITGIRFEDHIRQAGFQVVTITNQGVGA